jgi:ABC-type amino acid transport substrate-binding protein
MPASTAPSAAIADLAPSGRLRAAINFGNGVLAVRNPVTGEPGGISTDLARELARRLGVPIEFVRFEEAGKVVEGLKAAAWDVCFLAIDPLRRRRHRLHRALSRDRRRVHGGDDVVGSPQCGRGSRRARTSASSWAAPTIST